MRIRKPALGMLATIAVLWPAAALAEITLIGGIVEATLKETRFNIDGDSDEVFEIFPGTASSLPIRVVASLTAPGGEIAAAKAAAQFADPRDLDQPNPEEFAINLALNSATFNTRYEARIRTEELRNIVFRAGELGDAVEGETVLVVGRLFLDGALAIFAVDPVRDLLGAQVTLSVRVVQETDVADLTVFAGSVEINGGASGTATVSASGQVDTTTLILSDLASVSDDFGAFHVLIIPNLDIAYSYDASIEAPFKLRATVEVSATNLGGGVGIAALVGAPADALESVIGTTTGQAAAGKMSTTLALERANPTGVAAFPTLAPPAAPLPPLCGLFGIEAIVGLMLIGGVRCAARIRL